VLGNGTLLDLAENPPASRPGRLGPRGHTHIVVRRYGQDMLDAIHRGMEGAEHPPVERREPSTPRRRLDRRAEWRLERLKHWRATRASELRMDPGVFCANAALEEIAASVPKTRADLERLEHVKGWWSKAFADEILAALEEIGGRETREPAPDAPASTPTEAPPPGRRGSRKRRRSRRRRRGGQNASAG
jgi:ribonuclease D